MMSDEEKDGEIFTRHPPSYRSDALNKFLDKLDSRSKRKTNQQPRIPRRIGSPIERNVPDHAKNWMIKPELRKRGSSSNGGGDGDNAGDSGTVDITIEDDSNSDSDLSETF